MGFLLNMYSGNVLIPLLAPDRAVMHDISFSVLPYWSFAPVLNDILIIFMIISFIYIGFKNGFRNFSRYIWILASMYLLRSITIILNPVGPSYEGYDTRTEMELYSMIFDYNGYFFSAHTGLSLLLTLFIYDINRRWGYIFFIIWLIVIMLIIIGRSHYLIDIYGGIVTSLLLCYIFKLFPYKDI
ncbi:phosphatase PAP2 family protein [Candidatus Dojkabacteria bacterium]|nr:phosphatase PAP2 family protein [Candidatus Dojkabacteria bacterium]